MRIRHIKGVEELIAVESLVIQRPEAYKGRWRSEIYGNDAPLYLEIGMGMGTFIRTHSFNHPEINYLGLELNTTVLYKAVQRYKAELRDRMQEAAGIQAGQPDLADADSNIAEAAGDKAVGTAAAGIDCAGSADSAGVGNLRFIRSNARFLEEYFEHGEIDRIYLNFSDPWPKEHSAGRRLTSPQFLRLYESILKPDGVIEFKTDNRGLFDYSVETIPASGWKIDAITYDLHHDAVMNEGNIMTEYEAKFSSKGNPIYKLIANRA